MINVEGLLILAEERKQSVQLHIAAPHIVAFFTHNIAPLVNCAVFRLDLMCMFID